MSNPQRLWFVELKLYWEGRVNASHLRQEFGIGRTQATRDIDSYKKAYSENLYYNPSAKAYLPSVAFEFGYISGDVDEYLDWRHGLEIKDSRSHDTCLIAPIIRRVSPQIMRILLQAVQEQRVVDVDYVSVTHPCDQGRNIAPHSFVKTGQRWHLRAYCEKNRNYRDFVLSRFRGNAELMRRSEQGKDQDTAWNIPIKLIIAPDPRLSPSQQHVLQRDYGMTNGQLVITSRAALATYQLQDLKILPQDPKRAPESQQLILVNRSEVESWLFGWSEKRHLSPSADLPTE
jgi:hypothetical protein